MAKIIKFKKGTEYDRFSPEQEKMVNDGVSLEFIIANFRGPELFCSSKDDESIFICCVILPSKEIGVFTSEGGKYFLESVWEVPEHGISMTEIADRHTGTTAYKPKF